MLSTQAESGLKADFICCFSPAEDEFTEKAAREAPGDEQRHKGLTQPNLLPVPTSTQK